MKTLKIELRGIVQGVGFRPFVHRLATACGLAGSVANRGARVEVFAQGGDAALAGFVSRLRHEAPERALVMDLALGHCDLPAATGFAIVASAREPGDIFVSPDIGICPRCLKELFDPKDRRYLHPFINCTACGPRLSILDAMPYDRERTSMAAFPMCPACAREYRDPASRRFDAQPVCCRDCGPEVFMLDGPERGYAAIAEARRLVMQNGIVAVKGIGGFHLVCDAASDAAIARLRELKCRPVKPFAVMVENMAVAMREAMPDAVRRSLLEGWQKPIVLAPRRAGGRMSALVAPDNPTIGLMLPYTPLHHLLFALPDGQRMTDMLVMTSGNAAGAPICRNDPDARQEIAGFCERILTHNRDIRLRADDSVLDVVAGRPAMIRRSRGYAPLPCMMSGRWQGEVLGMGGELKNSFCLGRGSLFYLSPYVGDLGDLRTAAALADSLARLERLLEIRPTLVACDLHPLYQSSRLARELAAERGLPLLALQHHYAHVASCMAENDCAERVIGVSFDGTGYGVDGGIWGGEFLLADFAGFERAGHIQPFNLVGGDAAAREGWRVATAMVQTLFAEDAHARLAGLRLCDGEQARMLRLMAEKGINTVDCTSVGRLFDAVSAILGLCRASSFEGEAAMRLQFAAERGLQEQGLDRDDFGAALARLAARVPDEWVGELLSSEKGPVQAATGTLVADMVRRRLCGEAVAVLALRFHAVLCAMLVAVCEKIREQSGLNCCALSGGAFQNRLLLAASDRLLRDRGFRVLTHSMVPANDGGLALGQAVIAGFRQGHGLLAKQDASGSAGDADGAGMPAGG